MMAYDELISAACDEQMTVAMKWCQAAGGIAVTLTIWG